MRTISARDDLSEGFAVADGLEAASQRVVQRLRLVLGEWFLQPNDGIPHTDGLFADGATPDLAAQLVAAEVQAIEDVTAVEIVRVDLDPASRILSLELQVDTVHGQTTIREEV